MSRTRRSVALPSAALLFAVLAACGSSEHPEGFDGEIDCAAEAWAQTMEYERGAEGARTPYDAMTEWADVYRGRGHRVHVVSSRTATVVIEGAEIAFIRVFELASETFAVAEVKGCAGFEPAS